jgi:lipid-binding SYLF domain-containing protein
MRNLYLTMSVLFGAGVLGLCGCSTAPETSEARDVLNAQVDEAVTLFKIEDPGIQHFFDAAYGYAVFPRVTKGAFLVGGAYGRGEVFKQNGMVGYSSLSLATLGFSFGGEYFREIVFFIDKPEFDRFCSEEYVFAAQVTGIALTEGAAAKADYSYGKAVFIMADSGLMVDASLGGQKFMYTPKSLVESTQRNLSMNK